MRVRAESLTSIIYSRPSFPTTISRAQMSNPGPNKTQFSEQLAAIYSRSFNSKKSLNARDPSKKKLFFLVTEN